MRVRLRPGDFKVLEFRNRPTSQLCVQKFDDLDADGMMDPDEPLLSAWDFEAIGSIDSVTLTTGGENTCAWVRPGTYVVSEVAQPGWTPTDPSLVARRSRCNL